MRASFESTRFASRSIERSEQKNKQAGTQDQCKWVRPYLRIGDFLS